jgi:iron only hydrogenase large subunit-like protein
MLGALIKTYYAQQKEIDPESITSVSIMPCTAKKFEAQRPEMNASGFRDVDYVLTTRELARMIKEASIDFAKLQDKPSDAVFHPTKPPIRCSTLSLTVSRWVRPPGQLLL